LSATATACAAGFAADVVVDVDFDVVNAMRALSRNEKNKNPVQD